MSWVSQHRVACEGEGNPLGVGWVCFGPTQERVLLRYSSVWHSLGMLVVEKQNSVAWFDSVWPKVQRASKQAVSWPRKQAMHQFHSALLAISSRKISKMSRTKQKSPDQFYKGNKQCCNKYCSQGQQCQNAPQETEDVTSKNYFCSRVWQKTFSSIIRRLFIFVWWTWTYIKDRILLTILYKL